MERLLKKITDRTAHVAVIGLGYVGLPLAMGFAKAGYHVTGIDVDAGRVGRLKKGDSYIQDVPSSDLRPLVEIECAERIFRGERDMVFAIGHRPVRQLLSPILKVRDTYKPRHSRMSIMLRRSHVFTVFTGVSNLAASCSRLQPL